MNTEDLRNKADDIKGKAEDLVDEAKENIEDLTQGAKQDINRKGGEVKGRAEQWQDDQKVDHKGEYNQNQSTTGQVGLDTNPLDADVDKA
jgi:gas vesicle protein